MNALGAALILKGFFGEADVEAIDTKPDSEPAADAMGMDIEDDTEGAAATADDRMIVNDDAAGNNMGTLRVPATLPPSWTVKKVYRTVGPRPRHVTNNRHKCKRAHSPDTLLPQDQRI
jgi:hypothetical protein